MEEEVSEQIIGSYNPSDSVTVSAIKRKSKALIDVITDSCPKGRRTETAVTQIEIAAMLAVKSIFATNV